MRSATRYKGAGTQLLTRNGPPDHQYLVVWEIEADDLDVVRDQLRGMQGKTPHSDAMDWGGLVGVVFEQITEPAVKD
jgi:hypothetical protein